MQGSNLRHLLCEVLHARCAFRRTQTTKPATGGRFLNRWWAMQGSNLRHLPCEGSALPLS
jgi:hypothetical protein